MKKKPKTRYKVRKIPKPLRKHRRAKKGTVDTFAGVLKIAREAEANLIASRKKRDEEIYFDFGIGAPYSHILDLHHRIDELQDRLDAN